MSRIFAVLFSVVIFMTACKDVSNPRPTESEFWKDMAQRNERRGEEWRRRALFQLDRFKHVCDGSDFTEQTIREWKRMGVGAHAAVLSGPWEPWARERIRLFVRNPEWKAICDQAWLMPGPE